MDSRSIEYRRAKSRAYQKREYTKPSDGIAAVRNRLRTMREGAAAAARLIRAGKLTFKS